MTTHADISCHDSSNNEIIATDTASFSTCYALKIGLLLSLCIIWVPLHFLHAYTGLHGTLIYSGALLLLISVASVGGRLRHRSIPMTSTPQGPNGGYGE